MAKKGRTEATRSIKLKPEAEKTIKEAGNRTVKTAPRVVKTSLISSKKVKTHAALQKKQAQKSMKAAREAKWATIHSVQTAKQSAKTAKATGRGLKAMAEAAAHAVKAAFAALMAGGGAVFVVLIVIGPVMRTLSYFYSWGQRKQIRELFCTEYFLMQPVSSNRFVHGHSSFYH